MDQKKRTEIASLGQFGLIDLLTSGFTPKNASTLKGAGDDAAVPSVYSLAITFLPL